jgi:hypothetical protein
MTVPSKPDKTDHDMIRELYAAVCGVDGQDGLLRSHNELKKDHYKLKGSFWRIIWILTGALLVSGTFNGIELVKIIAGG